MKDLHPTTLAAVQAHITGIQALMHGGLVVVVMAETKSEERDELRRLLWERHGEDVYDPKEFAVFRKHGAGSRGDQEQATDDSMDFIRVPADTTARLNVPGLAHALRLWREEGQRKSWPEPTGEPDYEGDARYLLAAALSDECDVHYQDKPEFEALRQQDKGEAAIGWIAGASRTHDGAGHPMVMAEIGQFKPEIAVIAEHLAAAAKETGVDMSIEIRAYPRTADVPVAGTAKAS